MPSALQKRVARLEYGQPAQHKLLAVARMPVAEWSDELLAEFLEALVDGTPSAKTLMAGLSPANLNALIEVLRAKEEDL